VRKIIQFGFLLLFTYQLVGFFAFFEMERFFIRTEIKKAIKLSLPENQLIDFHFTEKEFTKLHWFESHEFTFNGRFYDVVRKSKTNGIWHFQCIDDSQESKLFASLSSACSENLTSTPPSHPIKTWLKVLNEPMEEISNDSPFKFCALRLNYSVELPKYPFSNYSDPYLFNLAPPPDFI
jgi:hypothetical protein